jgi:tripartite-type tricarboxylate transporter receptor subunit TctC
MSVSIGQPVIVDHRPGGGTIIGNNLVAKATPDGYTLVMGTITSHAMLSSLSTRMPFDPEKDFAPISLITSLPFVLIAHPSVPVANVPDLVALARQQPGKWSFGSAGNGTSNHLAGELFKSIAKIDMLHVPYKGSAPALADLLGGQITTMFDLTPTALTQIAGGKVKAIAITSARRSSVAPNIPTMAEAGMPGVEVVSWFGILAPAGTPAPIVNRLRDAVRAAVADPLFRGAMEKVQTPISYLDAPEFRGFLAKDAARLKVAVEKIGKVTEGK